MCGTHKEIIIWGAGKIGRGFIADIFTKAGYKLTFVDINRELVEFLKKRGEYTIMNCQGSDEVEEVKVENYEAFHISEKETIYQKLLNDNCIMAVVLFPSAFEETAGEIADIIEMKVKSGNAGTLDILICANTLHPGAVIKKLLEEKLSDTGQKYLEQKVGLIETVIMRIAIEPTEELITKDPLIVLTNGYPNMPVDKTAFKGSLPESDMIVYTENIKSEETRKMYTYNMIHVLFSYIGMRKGLNTVFECILDEEIKQFALEALEEASRGIQAEYNFSAEEMALWNKAVLKSMSNPILKDKLERVGADPVRKLGRNDRLVGPALLCRKNGIIPYYLSGAIAGAFLYDYPGDPSCGIIKEYISEYGIKEAVRKFCGLDKEMELVQMIVEHYEKLLGGMCFFKNTLK